MSDGQFSEEEHRRRYSVLSLFSGIGGICDAFENTGRFRIAMANEIDDRACETYRLNHPDRNLVHEDVMKVHAANIPRGIDAVVGGFPCQPFSKAGHQLGFEDPRGKLFFEIMRLVDELNGRGEKPRAIFLENVERLVTMDNRQTFNTIMREIRTRGYWATYRVLNSKDYSGVPQNRKRVYIVAFDENLDHSKFRYPQKVKMRPLTDFIDIEQRKDDKCYYSTKNAKHFDMINREVTKPNTVYQFRRVYVRRNTSGVCPALTANMGGGGHNVPLIRDKYGVRRLTVEECLAFQGFDPETFRFPENMADSHRYKQIGNSVTVPVVQRIAEKIADTLDFNAFDQ